ncbi:MAG: hypothetical protein K2R98_12300 [Gemmataceae bacterium]|nr:hypothetical protein [Gemmataceae bacterium]
MFQKISNSFALATSSARLLWQEKQLLIFPFVSGLACLLVVASFCIPFIAHPALLDFPKDAQGDVQLPFWVYPALFSFYFVTYFVVIFFNSALISCAVLRFNGQEATLGDGLSIAVNRLPQILAWALVSATVGFLLKLVESAHERIGEIVSALLGTAWSVMTYFVVPVLVVEKVGPIDAIQRSLSLLKKSWGEALVGQAGLGIFMFVLMLPAILLVVLGVLALQAAPALGIALFVLAALYFLVWSAVGPALNGIFLAALYQYATTGSAPNGFDQQVMATAFAPKAS